MISRGMPRRKLIKTSEFPYHITMRSNNREWFDLPLEKVWTFCLEAVNYANKKHAVRIQAFVLMNNHYHALIWTPFENIDLFMYEFNKKLSLSLRVELKRINRIFGGRYKWSLVTDSEYYSHVLRYIYQNPLKANTVANCENYKFSTLRYFVLNKGLPFKLYNPIIGNKYRFLEYINESGDDLYRKKMDFAISRPIFAFPSRRTLQRRKNLLV